MVTISITPAAFVAIASTRPDDQGGYHVTLDLHARDRLNARRRPGESYSAVILRLAKGRREVLGTFVKDATSD